MPKGSYNGLYSPVTTLSALHTRYHTPRQPTPILPPSISPQYGFGHPKRTTPSPVLGKCVSQPTPWLVADNAPLYRRVLLISVRFYHRLDRVCETDGEATYLPHARGLGLRG